MAIKRNDKVESDRVLTFESVVTELMPFIDTPFALEIQLGQTRMTIRELLELDTGSVVELKRSAGEPMDVLSKGKVLMRGEVTVLEDTLGLRIVEIVHPHKKV
ncbi:MAG: FliM/FliN family flagellar motor switch protein [Holophaga sp.]|nr:FliM/FliN family flagellar motor switch protein [Holophaga sp.]